LAVFLKAYFKFNDSGLSSLATTFWNSSSKQKSDVIFFTGMLIACPYYFLFICCLDTNSLTSGKT
jgi:hypothetical protein